jgi:hypothetical protein
MEKLMKKAGILVGVVFSKSMYSHVEQIVYTILCITLYNTV